MNDRLSSLEMRVADLEARLQYATAGGAGRASEVLALVCSHYGLLPIEVKRRGRRADIVQCRQAACWVMVESGIPRAEICLLLGISPSSVAYSIARVDAWAGKEASAVVCMGIEAKQLVRNTRVDAIEGPA